jgi:hypothetical protein
MWLFIGRTFKAFTFALAILFAVSSSGKRDAEDPPSAEGKNQIEARLDMRYRQPYSNPQLNSFQPVKLTASGRLAWKIVFNDGSVPGEPEFILLLDDNFAIVDYGEAIFAVDLNKMKCLGYRSKSANSFVSIGPADTFYFADSFQLIRATLNDFKADPPDFFVPGLGQYSELRGLIPLENIFLAAVQNLGNRKYPAKSLTLFQKPYESLNCDWRLEFDGLVLSAPATSANQFAIARENTICLIDKQGKISRELPGEFSPISCSIGPDDIIYLVCATPAGPMLKALDQNLELKWEAVCGKQKLAQPPLVDPVPTIYLVGEGSVTAFQNGRMLWETPLSSESPAATMAQGGKMIISDGARIGCLNGAGTIDWSYEEKDGEIFLTPPVLDSKGRILVATAGAILMIE